PEVRAIVSPEDGGEARAMLSRVAFVLSVSLLAAPALAAPALAASNTNTIIAREKKTIIGQTVTPPPNPTIIASTRVFPPGAKTPVHKHLYPQYVFVTAGTLTITNVESVSVTTYVVDQVPAGTKENRVLREAP